MYCLLVLFFVAEAAFAAQKFFHQSVDQHKLAPGWQEPGLWRPRWIMDRVFHNDDGTETSRDRLYFKLKMDRTMQISRSNKRPLLEIMRKSDSVQTGGGGGVNEKSQQKTSQEGQEDEFEKNVDGTWWWQDGSPLNFAYVKMETRERGDKGELEKIRHDVLADWGTLDGYAFNFRRGKIIISTSVAGLPVGSKVVGSFSVKVSPHRPLVSKDFMAFQ